MTQIQAGRRRDREPKELPASLAAQLTPVARQALRHPLRRQILRTLNASKDAQSAADIAAALDTSVSRVSYHAQVLASCGGLSSAAPRNDQGGIALTYISAVDDDRAVLSVLKATRRLDRRLCP